jgi:hypothetical protein
MSRIDFIKGSITDIELLKRERIWMLSFSLQAAPHSAAPISGERAARCTIRKRFKNFEMNEMLRGLEAQKPPRGENRSPLRSSRQNLN